MWGDVATAVEDGGINYSFFLQARLLLGSVSFHAKASAVLKSIQGGVYTAARFKGKLRWDAKHREDLTETIMEPSAQFIKVDGGRGTAKCDSHQAAHNVHSRLFTSFPGRVLIVKDRRDVVESRDVLVVIRHDDGYCYEIQIAFDQTFPLKAFSHTPYNLMRLDSFGMEDLLPFTTIYNFPMDVRGHSRSEVKSKLNLG